MPDDIQEPEDALPTQEELDRAEQAQEDAARIAAATRVGDPNANISAIPHTNPIIDAATSPSFATYATLSQRLADQVAYIRRQVTDLSPTYKSRADPLGIYQDQDLAPEGYQSTYRNLDDDDGVHSFCYVNRMGTCAEPAKKEAAAQKEGNWLSKLKQHTFFGSAWYERTNLVTASFCLISSESVAVPIGAKSLRVGIGLPGLWRAASYFEEGGGKYVNFYTQCHHAGLLYQTSSPTLEIQGTTGGMVSFSTSAKKESMAAWAAWVAMCVNVVIPPVWRKSEKYRPHVRKKRRADLSLVGANVTMKAGELQDDALLDRLRGELGVAQRNLEMREHKSWLAEATSHWWTVWVGDIFHYAFMFLSWPYAKYYKIKIDGQTHFKGKYINKKFLWGGLKKRIKKLEQERMHLSPSFSMQGAMNKKQQKQYSLMALSVPYKDKEHAKGGSTMVISADHLVIGGHKEGPDILVDTKEQKIRAVVGHKDAPILSILDINAMQAGSLTIKSSKAGMSFKVVKGIAGDDTGKYENVLNKNFNELFSELFVGQKGIRVLDETNKQQLTLSKQSFRMETPKKITITTTKKITLQGKSIKVKGAVVKVNGSSLLVT
jgi:hypothetical protein